MHGHKVDRAERKTATDGAHAHLFEVNGELVETAVDGEHSHALEDVDAGSTETDGEHGHAATLPDGAVLQTDTSGEHSHPVAVRETGIGGPHQHSLELSDGSLVQSLTAAQFWRRFIEKGGNLRLRPHDGSHVELLFKFCKRYEDDGKDEDDPDKRLKQEEKRLVGGVVLPAAEVDLQDDTVSRDEIRQAAHRFAAGLNLGTGPDLMHEVDLPPGVSIVETYLAPVDFQMGEDAVITGSWVMWMHIANDEIWAGVLSGDIAAFSIVGTAQRVPVDGAVE